MNAYELADDVKNISNTIEALEWVQKATPLLRQQADRIAELENHLDKYSHYEAMTHQEYTQQIMQLEQEKIRAYDNGYEDGQKSYTQSSTQLHPESKE